MSQDKSSTSPPQPSPPATSRANDPFSPRAIKQLSLLLAGSTFLLASIAVTRRSIARKQIAAFPKFYQPNNRTPPANASSRDSFIAVEALGLATLNVFSFAMVGVGGLLYACDISSVEELRKVARRKMYGPGTKTDEDADREIEMWAAGVLSKIGKQPKDGKDKDS